MKKRCLPFALMGLSCVLSSCAFFPFYSSNYEDSAEFSSRSFRLINKNEVYPLTAKTMTLYFKDGGELPYVDVRNFLNSLEGLYQTRYFGFQTPTPRRLTVSWRDSSNTYSLTVDDQKDAIEVSSLTFFDLLHSTSGTDYSFDLKSVGYSESGGEGTVFSLGSYGIDIYRKKDLVLLPLCVANTIFCSSHYLNLYYNGSAVYSSYFNFAMDEECQKEAFLSNQNWGKAIPEDVAKMNKANFLFILDRYYGLWSSLPATPEFSSAQELLSSTNEADVFSAMDSILMDQIDEMHTSFDSLSFYAPTSPGRSLTFGKNRAAFLQESKELEASYKQAYPENEPVRYAGDTAILVSPYPIQTGSLSELKDKNGNLLPDAYQKDSFYYMKEMISRIDSHGGIKNILIDLSRNGGGNLGALFRILGLMSDEDVTYASKNRLDNKTTVSRMKVDADEDGDYSDKDAVSSYNWGLLTSKLTFSAANYWACYVKDHGIGKIFGEQSGGGACSIVGFVNADGSSFHLSGPSAMMTMTGKNDFHSVAQGAVPDKEVDPSSFYGNDAMLDELFD